jgi:hypothetical protein
MNIFVLDPSPETAAQMHCDRHVVKMILESTQILSTVMHQNGLQGPYRPTHKHHPCVRWAGESKENFEWLRRLLASLCAEYTLRYGKTHKCQQYLDSLSCELPDTGLTPFAQAMPPQYRDGDPVRAYRRYYMGEKAGFATWKTHQPNWFKNN